MRKILREEQRKREREREREEGRKWDLCMTENYFLLSTNRNSKALTVKLKSSKIEIEIFVKAGW